MYLKMVAGICFTQNYQKIQPRLTNLILNIKGGVMDIEKIKELALANGFKLKEQASGNLDLNAYVYDFANAVEQEAKAQADAPGHITVTHERFQELIAIGVKAALDEREQK